MSDRQNISCETELRRRFSLNATDTRNTSARDTPENFKTPEKTYQAKNVYKEKYMKLSQAVKVVFLSIKRRIVKEDANCMQSIKDTIPIQEDDETSAKRDPVQLAQYVKKIYEKTTELRVEEKRKLIENNEKSLGQYEPLLQKLEAEVRKHIQIEQQMKILLENQQDTIRELEKNKASLNSGNAGKNGVKEEEFVKIVGQKDQKIKELEEENSNLNEQLKKAQLEIQNLKGGMSDIAQILKGLGASCGCD